MDILQVTKQMALSKIHDIQCKDKVNLQRSDRFFQNIKMKNIRPSTTTSTNLIFDPQSNSDELLKCDKENNSVNIFHNSNLQNMRYKKRCYPLQDRHVNKQNGNGYETDPMNEQEKMQCDVVASPRTSMDSQYSAMLSPVLSPQSTNSSRSSLLRLDATNTAQSVLLRRVSSGYESMDDALMSDLDTETTDVEMQLPSDISKLLSGDIVAPEVECDVSTTPKFSHSSKVSTKVRWLSNRCLQNQIHRDTISPPMSKIRTCLFRSPTANACSPKVIHNERSPRERIYYIGANSPLSNRSYKRSLEELPNSADGKTLKKFRKSNSLYIDPTIVESMMPSPLTHSKPNLQRSLSENEAKIKWAVHRSFTDSDLIGDFSKPCVLPLTNGNHTDLKNITTDTLAALLRNEFADRVDSYTIIDCRYPYEYDAGHIRGALNIYTQDLVNEELLQPVSAMVPQIQPDFNKRHILVFHCEFSLERGPNLSRFLRSLDRKHNKEHYPALYYPEIYLLNGGYEKFYKEQREFCSPQNYKPMKHPDHMEECKLFRSKSKSWQGNKSKGGNPMQERQNLKRLGF